jgi:hypothetical protein
VSEWNKKTEFMDLQISDVVLIAIKITSNLQKEKTEYYLMSPMISAINWCEFLKLTLTKDGIYFRHGGTCKVIDALGEEIIRDDPLLLSDGDIITIILEEDTKFPY